MVTKKKRMSLLSSGRGNGVTRSEVAIGDAFGKPRNVIERKWVGARLVLSNRLGVKLFMI